MWSVPTRGTTSLADDCSTSTANSFSKVYIYFFGGWGGGAGDLFDFLFGRMREEWMSFCWCVLGPELVNSRAPIF